MFVYEVLPSHERKPEAVLYSVGIIAIPFECGASHLLVIEVKQWWHIPLISALRSQRQRDLCEFKATLCYVR